jgi:hypothetical protein
MVRRKERLHFPSGTAMPRVLAGWVRSVKRLFPGSRLICGTQVVEQEARTAFVPSFAAPAPIGFVLAKDGFDWVRLEPKETAALLDLYDWWRRDSKSC